MVIEVAANILLYQLQVLKCWDVKEHVCLQTLAIRFPFGHIIPEHGPYPLHLLKSPVNSLLICSNDCLAEIKLSGLGVSKSTKTTHAKPLCAALYNASMTQVRNRHVGAQNLLWERDLYKDAELFGCLLKVLLKTFIFTCQVITGCEGSVISFWDLLSGRKAQQLAQAHNYEEISCMAMDASEKRLMTGARNGSIHVSITVG